jgi:hypothetical protein
MNISKQGLIEAISDYNAGLINDIEFLLKVQIEPMIVERMLAVQKLPYRASAKIIIDDLYNDDPRKEPLEHELVTRLTKSSKGAFFETLQEMCDDKLKAPMEISIHLPADGGPTVFSFDDTTDARIFAEEMVALGMEILKIDTLRVAIEADLGKLQTLYNHLPGIKPGETLVLTVDLEPKAKSKAAPKPRDTVSKGSLVYANNFCNTLYQRCEGKLKLPLSFDLHRSRDGIKLTFAVHDEGNATMLAAAIKAVDIIPDVREMPDSFTVDYDDFMDEIHIAKSVAPLKDEAVSFVWSGPK